MRILIAGATGAIGREVVGLLVDGGHDVFGSTRYAERATVISRLGATPVILDALATGSVESVFDEIRPEAVIHLLTALPRNGPRSARDLEATNALRIQGTANLIDAAVAVGCRRMVAESLALGYPKGERATEETPFARGDSPMIKALASLEDQIFDAAATRGMDGITVRFGIFYGPGAGSTRHQIELLKRRRLMVIKDDPALTPWIHLADAAAITVAALFRGISGRAYNAVDDEPSTPRVFLETMARMIGAPKPRALPERLARIIPSPFEVATGYGVSVSNQRIKQELGVGLAFPDYREGVRSLALGS